jgi:5'-deoxynucleotidase YfbR-like HD superfamily hydrolase
MTHGDAQYVTTITGRRFWPLDPRVEDVCIEDIAHALAHLCRFNGHVQAFYSVAQHSVLVAQHVAPEDALQGLLHDASEAYLCDLSRVVKHDANLARYRFYEGRLQGLIYAKYGLPLEEAAAVKAADTTLLQDEVRWVALHADQRPPYMNGPGFGVQIVPWPPVRAKREFLSLFETLTNGR